MDDRNYKCSIPAVNPKEESRMSSDTGNAGADGYSVLSRADRFTKRRPPVEDYSPRKKEVY